jgi:phosphoenolpyruvate---glycerone phosphotransferase subunit DhaK
MQRILNDLDMVVDNMLEGYLKAYPFLSKYENNNRVIIKKKLHPGNVGIVTGGGSGHEPAFLGYIGKNMLDAAAIGEIFSSPTAKSFYDAFTAANRGNGIACLYGNYAGDNMNVRLAIKMAANSGILVKTVVANDDVASAPIDEKEKRRGGAGEIMMWKTAGAVASTGASLDEVIRIAQKTINNTRSIGVGLTSCTIPAVGHPNFFIEEGKMELGIGHHGEKGIQIDDLKSADEIADFMVDAILSEFNLEQDQKVAILISGLGATPIMEQYIFYNRVHDLMKINKLDVYKAYIGNYFTSLEMMGVSLTITLLDKELLPLISAQTQTPGLTQL